MVTDCRHPCWGTCGDAAGAAQRRLLLVVVVVVVFVASPAAGVHAEGRA